MARYRKVDVRIWNDAGFRRLSPAPPNAQTLWLFLLTAPQTTSIPGLFSSGEAAIAEQLGWPLKGFREVFQELFREGFVEVDWGARLIWLRNAIEYDPPANPNVVKSWATVWDEIPECELKTQAYQRLKGFLEGYGKGFAEGFAKACPEPSRKGMAKPESRVQSPEPESREKKQGALPLPSPLPLVASPLHLQELWNELRAPEMPEWKETKPGSDRDKAARARLRERPLRGTPDSFEAVILRIAQSDFARGIIPGRDGRLWRADPDFLLQSNAATKVLEGKYDNRRTRADVRKGPIRAEDVSTDKAEKHRRADGTYDLDAVMREAFPK